MISDKSSLSSRLGWILDETEQLLENTRQFFTAYTQDQDIEQLDAALEQCRDVVGVLEVLGAEGAYKLSREIGLLMEAVRKEAVGNWTEACQTTADGLLRLVEYLKHLHEGYADLPVIVLPTLNNLRAARDAELLSEHLVFLPAEGSVTNEQIGTEKYIDLDGEKRGQSIRHLRYHLQKALLGWYQNEQPVQNLQAARKVAVNMLVLHKKERLRSLWWVAGALLQALEEKRLDHNVAVKMLLGRMEREVRQFAELDEETYNETLSNELLKNLLYYVGLAENGGGMLAAVKETYHLNLYLPKGETLDELRQYYTMPGRELWQSVSATMQDELNLLMAQVESLEKQEGSVVLLQDIAKRTRSLAQALGMLGLGIAANLTDELAGDQESATASESIEQSSDRLLLKRTSEHYLKLEALLHEYAETGFDRTEEIFFGGNNAPEEAGANREVARTAMVSLARAQVELANFYQDVRVFQHLEEIVKILYQINGTLDVTGYREVQPLVSGVKVYLNKDLLSKRREPVAGEVDCVADLMTLLEAVLSCINRKEDHLPLLPVGYAHLQQLNTYTSVDLLEEAKVEEGSLELENKKKAKLMAPSTLYQKLRNQSLLHHV